jgi:hypothetical protein
MHQRLAPGGTNPEEAPRPVIADKSCSRAALAADVASGSISGIRRDGTNDRDVSTGDVRVPVLAVPFCRQ